MSAFQPGDVIGRRYRLIELLGTGAMGVVWSARNEAIDRSFAIKLMRSDATANPSRVQRFFREAKAAGRLRHRSIIEVYDLGCIEQLEGEPRDPHAGTPFLVMELLEGEPLDGLLRRVGKLPVGTALRMVAEVARGLHVAHKHGIIHRDLKPGNLFLHRSIDPLPGERAIEPKILDFGVSKLLDKIDSSETTEGTILGSPAYMSPEQTWGESDLDGRADVWSLGVVLYKMLSATLPFEGTNFHAIMMAINAKPAQPLRTRAPELSPEVCALVHRCLEKERSARYPSAIGLSDAIDTLLATHAYPEVDLAPLLSHQSHQSAREISRVGTLPRPSSGTLPVSLAATGGSATVRLVETRELAPSATMPMRRPIAIPIDANEDANANANANEDANPNADIETLTHLGPAAAAATSANDDSAEGSAQIAAIARPRTTRASTSFVIVALSVLTVCLTAALVIKSRAPDPSALTQSGSSPSSSPSFSPSSLPSSLPSSSPTSDSPPALAPALAPVVLPAATGAAKSSAIASASSSANANANGKTFAKSSAPKKKSYGKAGDDPPHEGVLRAGF